MADTADVKADLYRVLAHPMRLRVLELLQTQERSARDLQTLLELDSGAVSQHLSALRRQGLVEARREGTTAIYKLTDPRVGQLLELGREIISTRLTAQHAVLEELAAERVVELVSVVSAALISGTALLGAGAALPVVSRRVSLALALQAIGVASVGGAGVALVVTRKPVGSGFTNALTPVLGADGLSGFFLATLAIVAVASLVFAIGYLAGSPAARAIASLTGWFVLVLVGLVCARDVVSFLACWELMTVLPAATILVARQSRTVRRSVFVYLAITHIGGVGVWVSLLLLAHIGAFTDPHAFAGASTAMQTAIAVGAIVGFGTKAGLMPFHSWLPRAHPIAPSHISALMSGVMIKLALYGLIRVEFSGPAPASLGCHTHCSRSGRSRRSAAFSTRSFSTT